LGINVAYIPATKKNQGLKLEQSSPHNMSAMCIPTQIYLNEFDKAVK